MTTIKDKIKQGQLKRKNQKREELKNQENQKETKETKDSKSYMEQAKEIYSYRLSHETDLKDLTEKYPTFYSVFPEVVNYMITLRAFSPRAFDKVLKKKEKIPRTMQSFWVLQGTYARELYKVMNNHYDTSKANQIFNDTVASYEKVFNELQELEKELEEEKKEKEKEFDLEKRKELIEFMKNMKNVSD